MRNVTRVSLSDSKWVDEASQFNKDFIESCNSKVAKDIFFNLICSKTLIEVHNDLLYLLEKMKIQKVEKLVHNLHYKEIKCYLHKKSKTRIKSYISFEKSS